MHGVTERQQTLRSAHLETSSQMNIVAAAALAGEGKGKIFIMIINFFSITTTQSHDAY